MAWAPLKFNIPLRRDSVLEAVASEPALGKPTHDSLDHGKTKKLLGVCTSVLDGASELVSFVDKNRAEARKLGIETIAIELSGIVEGGRLQDIRDSLDEAVKTSGPAEISTDGLAKLRRAESLLADAVGEMDKGLGLGAGRLEQSSSGVGYFWIPFAIVGVAAIGVLIFAYKPTPPPTSVLPRAAPKLGSRVFLGSRLRK